MQIMYFIYISNVSIIFIVKNKKINKNIIVSYKNKINKINNNFILSQN